MNCPVCSNELRVADRQGIEIDFCPKCRGVWLDRGELEKVIERSRSRVSYGDHDEDDEQGHHGRGSNQHGGPYPPQGNRRESFFSRLFDFD